AGLELLGKPHATIVSYTGDTIYAVADRLEARGWSVDRQHRPPSIHLTVTANHAPIVDEYLADLRAALVEVRANPALVKEGKAPMYGMAARLPLGSLVASRIRDAIAEMYRKPDGRRARSTAEGGAEIDR